MKRDALVAASIGAAIGCIAGIVLVIVVARPMGILGTSACGPSTLVEAGFDPWTGQPRGQVVQGSCMGHDYVTTSPIPNDLLGHVGLPWGSLVVVAATIVGGLACWVVARRLRQPA